MKWKLFLYALALLPAAATRAQTPQQKENLYTFTRLYGYVRYFHPSDASVITDWEKFAVYGAKEVEQAANTKELQQTLERLFKPIAPSLLIYPTGAAATFNIKSIMPPDTAGMKVVTWQHTGYGAGSNNTTYKSVRTNSYIKGAPPFRPSDFSTITGSLDATPYQGRMVRYSAALKAENLNSGTAQLWLRVDRPNQQHGFFDNMDNRPVTGEGRPWRRDTITGKISDDARAIVFGCFITQNGRALLDDITLEIQTPHGEWKTIDTLNGDFEKDTANGKPAYWWFPPADPVFTVKITGENAATGKQALLLDRNITPKYTEKTGTLFPLSVAPGSVITKNIGSGLSITLPVALWGNGEQTWPLTDTVQTAQRNRNMAAGLPSPLTGDNLYVRLGGVIITWNVFQHFHPYYKEWITNWDNDLRLALTECYTNNTAGDFGNTLKTLTAKMRDGHTGVRVPVAGNNAFVPLKWEWVEEKLVVTDVLDSATGLQRGDVINAINGKPAKEFIGDAAKKVSAGSLNALVNRAVLNMSAGPKDAVLALSVASKGNVDVRFSYGAGAYYKDDAPKTPYRKIDSSTVYVNMSLMPWKDMSEKMPEIAGAPVVIFDMRGYPNGMNGSMIVAHLMKQPETVKWMQQQMLVLPDHENTGWTPLGWNVKPARPHITGKVYFLTNANAISYAESVMGYIKGQGLGTIVGEPTAGANGDVNMVTLPGGYSFSFTGLKVTNHDGSQHFMKGVQPDVMVYRTINGIIAGRDEVLEKAVGLSKGTVKISQAAGK